MAQRTRSFRLFGCRMPGKKREPLSSTVFKSFKWKKMISYGKALARLGSGAGREETQGTIGEMYKIRLLSVAGDSLTHPRWFKEICFMFRLCNTLYCSYNMVYLFITLEKFESTLWFNNSTSWHGSLGNKFNCSKIFICTDIHHSITSKKTKTKPPTKNKQKNNWKQSKCPNKGTV